MMVVRSKRWVQHQLRVPIAISSCSLGRDYPAIETELMDFFDGETAQVEVFLRCYISHDIAPYTSHLTHNTSHLAHNT
jgi:hypothetical protein